VLLRIKLCLCQVCRHVEQAEKTLTEEMTTYCGHVSSNDVVLGGINIRSTSFFGGDLKP